MPFLLNPINPITRTARACFVLLLALGLSACAGRISALYEAKALDRVVTINEKILTQFDRLLNTPLVCRPQIVASESFQATYGEIEVLLRVHQMAEGIRPANTESAEIASRYLQSWELHRLSHQLWPEPKDVAKKRWENQKKQLKIAAASSAAKINPEENQRLVEELELKLELELVTLKNEAQGLTDAVFVADQIKHASMACEAASGETTTYKPQSSQASLNHLRQGYLGDFTLTNMRNLYVRFSRAALVIEEARRMIADEKKQAI